MPPPPAEPRVLAVALGGNALSPPRGEQSYAVERAAAAAAARSLAALAAGGRQLLVVHGNGPQVGRLLRSDAAGGDLDVLVAQTQGELGYLLAEALEQAGGVPTVAVVTRVIVDPLDPAFGRPTKPIGPALSSRPGDAAAVEVAGGWRRVVASPRPLAVVEQGAVAALLASGHHVVAGGGGGIALARAAGRSRGLPAVVDKDWVAARLAIAFGAETLVFATDVAGVEEGHGGPGARVCPALSVAAARALLETGVLGAGSMAPKVESAADFVAASGRWACILHTDALARLFETPPPGTRIGP